MKPALPHERFASREAEALARSVGLGGYLTLSSTEQVLVLERALGYVNRPTVSDGEIVCMFRGADAVLSELFDGAEGDRLLLLLSVVGSLRYPVLDRFDSRVLMPFLMRLCSHELASPIHVKTALAALQHLAKENAADMMDLFEERHFLGTLGAFLLKSSGRVQGFASQIVYTLSAQAAVGGRLYASLDKLLLPGAEYKGAPVQLVETLCNLCLHVSAAAGGEVVFPLVLELIHALSKRVKEMKMKQVEEFVLLLRLVCGDSPSRLQRVFGLCVEHGWFVCFGQLMDNDETLGLMQDFAMLALPSFPITRSANPQPVVQALRPVVLALQAKLARETLGKQDAYWTVLCLLHFDHAGVPGCKLPTLVDYEAHGRTAVVSLHSLLEPGKNVAAVAGGCKLSELLSSIALMFKHLASVQRTSKLRGKKEEEALVRLLLQALEVATRQEDATAMEWAKQCLHAIGHTGNGERPSKLVKQQQPDDEVAVAAAAAAPTVAVADASTHQPENDEETVLSQVLSTFRQYLVDFDCYREMTTPAFLEMGLSSQQHVAFSRWLTKEDDGLLFDERLVAQLPVSLDEKKALCLHRDGLLARPESEWVRLGLSSLCRSRVASLVVKKQRERFDYALRFRW